MEASKIKEVAEEYIKFFEEIPEEKWTSCGLFEDPENRECKCAMGHLGWRDYSDEYELSKKYKDLLTVFSIASMKFSIGGRSLTMACVNDGFVEFTHPLGDTPKERILNVLKAAKGEYVLP